MVVRADEGEVGEFTCGVQMGELWPRAQTEYNRRNAFRIATLGTETTKKIFEVKRIIRRGTIRHGAVKLVAPPYVTWPTLPPRFCRRNPPTARRRNRRRRARLL